MKKGDFVIQGAQLCGVEQYLGDNKSTFEQEDYVYASKAGIVKIDEEKRTILVDDQRPSLRIEKGDYVICEVTFVRKFSIGCRIAKCNENIIHNRIYGNVHISQISNSYIESIDDAYKKTDIIRAKVSGRQNGELELTTKFGSELGVIYAQCTICGTIMVRQGINMVVCPFCGSTERKKLADDFAEFNEPVNEIIQ